MQLLEKLHAFGWLGCLLCIVGSVEIVLNAPEEKEIEGVKELFAMAMRPGFVTYAALTVGLAAYLATRVYPTHGTNNILVPIGICSLIGSLSVMSCKALGTALKLTFAGRNQLFEAETWICAAIVGTCVVTQMNYLNKALDVFNTAETMMDSAPSGVTSTAGAKAYAAKFATSPTIIVSMPAHQRGWRR